MYNTPISYILATKNRAKYLIRFMDSIKGNLKTNDELIIVEGSSIDKTKIILNNIKDNRIKVYSENHINAEEAYNFGFKLAKNEIIKPLMDDDEYFYNEINKVANILYSKPEVEIIVSGGVKIYKQKKRIINYFSNSISKSPIDVFLYGDSIACGVGFIFKKSLINKIGGFDINIKCSDLEFILRVFKKKINYFFCRSYTYNHTIYEHSALGKERLISWKKDYIKCIEKYLDFPKLFNSYFLINIVFFIIRNYKDIKLLKFKFFYLKFFKNYFSNSKIFKKTIKAYWDYQLI